MTNPNTTTMTNLAPDEAARPEQAAERSNILSEDGAGAARADERTNERDQERDHERNHERTQDRTNDEWLADLRAEGEQQAAALDDLKARLQRGIFYYLSRERSDLASLSQHELTQMAEDLGQDATLRVLDNLDSFRGDSLFTTWATRIAVRVAISDLRRARYRDFSLDNLTAEGDYLPASVNPLMGEKPLSPERAAEREEVMGRIQKALSQDLTDRQAKALVAIAVRGVPLETVAEQMGTNRNALYKLMHDARRKLRTTLEQQGLTVDYITNLFGE